MRSLSKILILFLLVIVFSTSAVYATALRGKVEDKITETVVSALSLPEEKVKISFKNLDNLNYAENSEVKVFLLSKRQPKGIVPIRVEIYNQGKLLKSKVFTIEIKIYEDVVVATNRLNRHEGITPDKIKIENRDITDFSDSYFKSKEKIKNKRARKAIPKGRILAESSLEEIPLVNRGDKVKIVAQIGKVRISVLGTAREDGALGEEIKVKNIDSKKIITAKVTDRQIVCINLGGAFD